MLLAGSTLRLRLSAALRPVVTGSGCTVCLQRMASPTMYPSPPASSSTAVPDEPRRTGSMRQGCCACSRLISGVIAKAAAWYACRRRRRRMPSVFTVRRENLVQERRIENRIEALLFTQGIRKRPRSWERDLANLRTGDGREMPRHLRAELNRLRRRLVTILELIREVEAERDELVVTTPQNRTSRKIVALCRIRGLGENFAAVLTREVFYRSFGNRRQIASYVGITPMPYQSGGMDRDRRISRAGNPRARTTMIQLAWLWLRYQPGSELAEWFRKRVGTLAGRTRRIAIVALTRKLLIALWRYVETGVVPAGVEIRTETVVAA